MIRPTTRLVLACLLLGGALSLGGCSDGGDPAQEVPEDPDVLVTWLEEGERRVLRRQDFDDLLLELPKNARFPGYGESSEDWLRRQLETHVERSVLGKEAPDDPEWAARLDTIQRDALVAEYLRRENADFDVTLADARAEYEERPDRYARPEQRSFRNLLVGVDPEAPASELDAACEEAEALRQQVLSGASFEQLVLRHSDSSNAAAGGAVVGVRREQLRGEVAEVVFSLEPGVPSRPLRTPAGCHLFYIINIVPASDGEFDLVRDLLVERIADRKRREWLIDILRTEAERQEVTLPQWFGEGLPEDLEDDSVLIERGDEQITVADFRGALRQTASPVEILLEETTQLLLPEGLERDDPEAARAIRERTTAQEIYRHRIAEFRTSFLAQLGEDDLRPIYEREKERLQSDPEVELTVYSWPIGPGDPLRSLDAPRRLAAALEAGADGEDAWASFADTPGAQRQAVPQTSLRRLLERPVLLPAMQRGDLEEGAVIGPYRYGSRIVLVKVETSIPSRQLSFLEVRGALIARWQEANPEKLELERRRVLEEQFGMKVWDQRIERYGETLLESLQATE